MLFSVKKRARGRGGATAATSTAPPRVFLVAPDAAAAELGSEPLGSAPPGGAPPGGVPPGSVPLGVLDLEFTRSRPTYVELCLVFPGSALRPDVFVGALRGALASFPSAAGRMDGALIRGTAGVRFSAVDGVDRAAVLSRPPHADLFDTPDRHTILKRSDARPEDNQVLTLRLSTAEASEDGTNLCALGVVFDHALCDVGGLGSLLAHISHAYAISLAKAVPSISAADASGDAAAAADDDDDDDDTAAPPAPTHDRAQQSRIQFKHARAKNASPASFAQPPPPPPPRLKGGVACVDIIYNPDLLSRLKAKYRAASRHEAAYTDLVLLLQAAGQMPPMRTATISRDDRVRSGLGADHFGNGVVMVDADFCDAALRGDGPGVAAGLRAVPETDTIVHPEATL